MKSSGLCRTQKIPKDAFFAVQPYCGFGVFAFISHHGSMDQKGG